MASKVDGNAWVEEREEGWGLCRKEPQSALVSRCDPGAMCWHSLHLAWSETSRISERRERGRPKAEGPGVMTRDVLGGKQSPKTEDGIKHFSRKQSAHWIRAWHCHEAQATVCLQQLYI